MPAWPASRTTDAEEVYIVDTRLLYMGGVFLRPASKHTTCACRLDKNTLKLCTCIAVEGRRRSLLRPQTGNELAALCVPLTALVRCRVEVATPPALSLRPHVDETLALPISHRAA